MKDINWPKKSISWIENEILYISVPFTWELPKIKKFLKRKSLLWNKAIIGGPAIYLMPDYIQQDNVLIEYSYPGILQKINPLATRTTLGCKNKCKFCGVSKIEPDFIELNNWPNLPIICDNNLLISSVEHFDRVIDKLKTKWNWADFNQGLDYRLLTKYHAQRLAEIKNITIRLALDSVDNITSFETCLDNLFGCKIAKNKIRVYALIGFDSDPCEAWDRCQYIEKFGLIALPMWFHELDSLEKNIITDKQKNLGWNDFERRRIFKWYYWHQDITKK